MIRLSISRSGYFFLTPDEDISPAWLERNGWNRSTVREGEWVRKASLYKWHGLSSAMGDRLQIDSSVELWLSSQGYVLEDQSIDESLLHPQLMEHQKRAIAWLANHKAGLLAPAPGLGKTAIALQSAQVARSRGILVVCPVTLIDNWVKEARKWLLLPIIRTWHGQDVKTIEDGDGLKIVITNYDTVVREIRDNATGLKKLIKKSYDTLIVDESVMVKNRKALRSQAIEDLAASFERVWLVSGSPASRYYDDMYFQLHILSPKAFSSYWRFANEYCLVTEGFGGHTSITGNKPDAEERLRRNLKPWYYPLSYADSGLNIPDWVMSTVPAPLGKKQWNLYLAMQNRFLAEIQDDPREILTASNVIAQMVRLNQIASNPRLVGGADICAKYDALVNQMEYLPGPYIVWVAYIDTAEWLKARLPGSECLTGQTPQAKRSELVKSFQEGKINTLICHPGVGKFGLTLTRARTAFYFERTWNGDDYYQSLYRLRRIGTIEPPNIVHIKAVGPENEPTIDDVIQSVLDYRTGQALKLTRELVMTSLKRPQSADIDWDARIIEPEAAVPAPQEGQSLEIDLTRSTSAPARSARR